MKTEILNRINQLRDAIAFSRQENSTMNIGEGILCNQEVAAWFKVLDGYQKKPSYTISKSLNKKVITITETIAQTNWKRKEIIY